MTNALINVRKAVDKSFAGEAEDVPIFSTSVAYGVYMAVSSNLRYSAVCSMRNRIMISVKRKLSTALLLYDLPYATILSERGSGQDIVASHLTYCLHHNSK